MSDVVPHLDTTDFDQLVELARGEIPRYAPNWTDHNLHDPGMTLIDLLAWIVDQQVFRAGFVGGRHRRAFAALLGQRPDGPTPAHGLIWPDGPLPAGRFVQTGTDVICLQHLDLDFALAWMDTCSDTDTGADLYLPPVALTGVGLTNDGVERPASPARGGSWALGRPADSAVTLRFDGPLGAINQPAWVSIGFEVQPPPGAPPAAGDRPWGPVGYAYRVGSTRWVQLEVMHDGTAGLARTGVVILAVPPAAASTASSELRLVFDRGFYPVSPQLRAATANVLPVVQRLRVAPASLGAGTGQPDQVVALDATGLLHPPDIQVGDERWLRRTDFAGSGPADPHYVLFPDRVLFGNGVNGRRPEVGADIRHAGLVRTLGVAGNLRSGLSWSLPALGSQAYGRNPEAFVGGAEQKTVDDLARAARQTAVSRAALLTDADLVAAAKSLTGLAVSRAEVVARFDRRLGDRHVDGTRTLVVVPYQPLWRDTPRSPAVIQASQAHLDAVADRLAPRRVLGERLIVQGPTVVAVDVAVTVSIAAGAAVSDVEAAVRETIHRRLSTDGAEPWPLGKNLTAIDLEGVAAAVSFVEQVSLVQVGIRGGPLGAGPILVPPDGLVVAERVEVTAEPGGWAR